MTDINLSADSFEKQPIFYKFLQLHTLLMGPYCTFIQSLHRYKKIRENKSISTNKYGVNLQGPKEHFSWKLKKGGSSLVLMSMNPKPSLVLISMNLSFFS